MSEAAYRILVVDDDTAQAEMMREFLRLSGFKQIDRASDIHGFWQILSQHDYDIILLDYRLPDGTGLDVLDQMARRKRQIPVIMVTGQGNERIAAQAILRGASDYLLKSGDYLVTLPALIQKSIQAHNLKLSMQKSLEQDPLPGPAAQQRARRDRRLGHGRADHLLEPGCRRPVWLQRR